MTRTEAVGGVLRIYILEADTWQGKPLYQQIVQKASNRELGGVTVTRGLGGLGASSRIHSETALAVRRETPVVIELADSEEKLRAFIPILEEVVETGLVTLNESRLVLYRAG